MWHVDIRAASGSAVSGSAVSGSAEPKAESRNRHQVGGEANARLIEGPEPAVHQRKRSLLLLLACTLAAACIGAAQAYADPTRLRLGIGPYVDTTRLLRGVAEGEFTRRDVALQVVRTPWEANFDYLVSDTLDVAMASLDEFVAKQKNLEKLKEPLVFFLPAWRFIGLGLYTKGRIKPLSEFRTGTRQERTRDFLSQLEGKIIALPEGTAFQISFLNFIANAGLRAENFRIVNAAIDAGLNGLEDPNVALAAVAAQQWTEAESRGYRRALSADELGAITVTGYMVKATTYNEKREALNQFACAWYGSMRLAESDPQGTYRASSEFITSGGGKAISYADWERAGAQNVIPKDASSAITAFLWDESPSYWLGAWEQATKLLALTGKAELVPDGVGPFAASGFLPGLLAACGDK